MINQSILTKTEEKVIDKKLRNEKLTKQDSYYLSVSIRPKLKQAEKLTKMNLLKRVSYNRRSMSTDNKVKEVILKEIDNVNAIVLYGSIIQNNYSNYKDIDVLIVTKKKLENKKEKLNLINKIEEEARGKNLNLDVQILDKRTILKSYPSNLSLIYQLKDHKVIYGKLKLPKKIEIPNIVLKMKMDWSEPSQTNPDGEEIYNCIRNTLLVKLVLEKIIDNYQLLNYMKEELGKNLMKKLKENRASSSEKNTAINYLKEINENTLKEINKERCQKIVI